jgi:putative transposase
MKKSRFTETQNVGILKEAESGLPMADLLRNHAISGSTFYS